MNKEKVSNVELFSPEVATSISLWEQIAHESGIPIYIKGGAVRDTLINFAHGKNLRVKDLDLVVPHGLFRVIQEAQKRGLVIVERGKRKKLPVYHLLGETGLDVDLSYLLASLDKDSTDRDILLQDALLSDLDINTISYNLLTGEINDPLGAAESIRLRRINLISVRSLFLNPASIFRCLKISYKTGFEISPESMETIRRNAGLVRKLERWFLERNIEEVLEYVALNVLLDRLIDLGLVNARPEIADYLRSKGYE